jgi:hypothetical protein
MKSHRPSISLFLSLSLSLHVLYTDKVVGLLRIRACGLAPGAAARERVAVGDEDPHLPALADSHEVVRLLVAPHYLIRDERNRPERLARKRLCRMNRNRVKKRKEADVP